MYERMLGEMLYRERVAHAMGSTHTPLHHAERANMAPRWTSVVMLRIRLTVANALIALATRIAPTVVRPTAPTHAVAQ